MDQLYYVIRYLVVEALLCHC